MRQRILLLCIGIVSYLYCTAQPNNDCSGAVSITTLDGTCTNFDNTGANPDIGPSSCTIGANDNVWFSFTAVGVSAQILVQNGPGVPEITLAQFTGAACVSGNFTEIDCANTATLVVDNVLTIGNTYYVMVAFTNNAAGTFDICIDNPVPAPNDACITATPLSNINGLCTQYNNDFPSTDILTPGCFTGSTYNVWFSFVAQGVSLDANISAGGPGVAQLAVIDFVTPCTVAGAVEVGCATGTNHIVLDNQLTIGQTYYLVVGFQNSSFTAGVGDFDLCVDNPIPAVNDNCNFAITIPPNVLSDPTTCFDVISGIDVNNDYPSTDVGLFSCWNTGDSYNVWYSFVAQGNDVEILVDPVFNNCDPEIALVQFTGTPCQIAGAQALDCANGTVLDFNDQLVIGQTYYVSVGFENNCTGDFCMNVFDPVPPPNDLPCDAEVLPTDGNCVDGTTIYANPEGFPLPPACQAAISNTVWYSISMSDPNNVGYTVDLSLDNGGPNTTVTVAFYEVTDCNTINNLVFFYCGAPPTMPIEFGPVDETATYYIMVGTSEPNETDFSICVDEIPPCFTNDLCTTATIINNVQSDMAFVCVPGCNLFADPETFNNNCGIGDFSTVWFQVNTDGAATLMNINVQSDDFDAPTITLFHLITDCSNLQNVGLTQSNLSCITGSNGEAEALGSNVGSNEIYYIAVSSLNNVGGNFTLCVNTISQASACVTSSQIQIVSRSSGGPLTGPFFPGETVSICMNVNSYTAAGNGCQWFQGMIPIFGNGWDPSSFDANGQPLNATVNGNNIGVAGNGLYGASTWDWFTGIGYHHTNVFFQVGDLDGNGTIEMCNILYDVNCPNLGGIMGGCCGPCWANAGDPLPPGWFAYGINGTCPTLGPPPTVDWGDGNTCGGGMGPWHFCFDLNVRDYPDCLTDPSTMDLSLGFFTTADGETGSWTGGPSVCALDQPLSLGLPMCCSVLTEDDQVADPLCSGQTFVYTIDAPGVDFWTWTYDDAGGVTGGMDGQGGPGSLIIATLFNSGSTSGTGEYTFLGFAGGACPVYQIVLTVPVYPEITASFTPLLLCSTPTNPYIISPNIIGGSGNYEYLWSPGGEDTPTITVDNPVNGTTYMVTVSDDIGCVGTASITIQVYTTFPVDIISPIVEQCIQLGPISLDVNATSNFPPYMYEWTTPGGTFTTSNITSDLSGQHLVVVTDDEGCIGKDSVTLILNETPEVTVEAVSGVTAICAGSATQLTAVPNGGDSPYLYDWDTPDGPETGKTILAMTPGTYIVTLEDSHGCTNTATIDILLQPSPVPDLGPDVLVCNFDQNVEITPTQTYTDYQWSTGPANNGSSFISVAQVGIYTVTVTNEFGCTGEASMEVSLFPQPVFPVPDTFEICPGSSITIDGTNYGGPWDYFIWDQCAVCQNQFDVSSAGDYQVTAFDDNGCSAYQEFTVVESLSLTPNLQGPAIICAGYPITLTADPGFVSYDWSTNQTSSSIVVNSPGTYSVTVHDNVGCTGIDSMTVISGDFVATITGPLSICSTVQSTLTASSGYASYSWSNTAVTDTIHVNQGTYSVTVTNSSGCTSMSSVTVVETPFSPVITGDNIICQTSETSTLDAGGPYFSYLWSANAGNATSQTVTVSTAGIYSVTITDISTCVADTSFTVSNHPIPPVTVTGLPDFCVGGNTQMTATAGYPNYVWNTNELTPTITINTAGNYSVTITDANGCTNAAASTVNPPIQKTVDISGSFVFCPGDQAILEVPPGYSSVLWSTGDVTDLIQTAFEGQVSVIVVDAGGCIAFDTVVTSSNSVLSPVITGDAAICDNGTAMLNAGPGFDFYQWSNGLGNTQIVSVNSPGTYSVTVSSLSGCVGDTSFQVTQSASPFAVVTPTATACDKQEPGGPTTVVNFNSKVTGGDTGGSWSFVSGPSAVNISNPANVNFSGLPAGIYTFSYTTNSSVLPCTEKSYNLVVTVNACACPAVSIGLAPDLCNDMGSINLSTLVTGTTGGVWTIISSPPGSNPAFITGGNILDANSADAGTYTLQYGVSGLPAYCSSSVTTTIKVLRTPVAGLAAAPLQFCAGENQNVTLSSLLVGADAGGTWIESSQNPSTGGAFNAATGKFNIVSQLPGVYTFDYVVAGPGPCPDDQVTVQVEIENNPIADAGATTTLDCNQPNALLGGNGSSTGPEFSYSWTTSGGGVVTNPNQLNATASAGGTYVLTVMNTLTGCSSVDQVVINQIGTFPSDLDLVVKSPDCAGDPPGSAQVMAVVGGVAPYSYSLNNAPAVLSPVFNNLPAGDYQLLVTDATGCKLLDSFTIEPQVNVDLSIINFVHDTLIYAFGDTIKFAFLYSGSSDTPDSLVWKTGDSVLCINCPVLELVANLASKITLEAYDIRGCKIVKSVSYLVVRKRDVYIPNVFSPNGDDLNDYFTLFTDADVKEITLMEVFTRWGDLVFRKSHFDPNDPKAGWDGTFKGESLNPGVYVYRIEILYGDNLEEKLAGDVTIIR